MSDSSKNRNQSQVREARSWVWIQIVVMLLGAVMLTGRYFEAIPHHSSHFALVMSAALVSALVAIGLCIELFLRMIFQGLTISRRRGFAVAIAGAIAIVLWVVGLLLR